MSIDTYVVILSIFSIACSITSIILVYKLSNIQTTCIPGPPGPPGPAGVSGTCNCKCKCKSKKTIDTDAYQ